MKKLLLVATTAICCFFFACKDTDNKEGDNSQAEKNKIANRDIYKGIETGDSTKFALIASDAVDHEGDHSGNEIKGGDNIKKMLTDMHNHIKDLKLEILADAAEGDYVFSMVHFTGVVSDNFQGTPSGTKMDMHLVDVTKFKDGKIIEHWGFYDPNEMMKMMQNTPQNMPGNMNMKKDSTGK